MGKTSVAPLNVEVETRITARANGMFDGNGNKIPRNPVMTTPDKSCLGVCGSMRNPNWRSEANAKPYTVHNQQSDSFCL